MTDHQFWLEIVPPLDHQHPKRQLLKRTHSAVLKQRTEKYRLEYRDVPSDGDCQFASIALALNNADGGTKSAGDVRRDVVSSLDTNATKDMRNSPVMIETAVREFHKDLPKRHLDAMITKGKNGWATSQAPIFADWADYIAKMKTKAWGDHFTLQEAAEVYNRTIVVVNAEPILGSPTMDYTAYAPLRATTSDRGRPIFIGYLGRHYVALLRRKDVDVPYTLETIDKEHMVVLQINDTDDAISIDVNAIINDVLEVQSRTQKAILANKHATKDKNIIELEERLGERIDAIIGDALTLTHRQLTEGGEDDMIQVLSVDADAIEHLGEQIQTRLDEIKDDIPGVVEDTFGKEARLHTYKMVSALETMEAALDKDDADAIYDAYDSALSKQKYVYYDRARIDTLSTDEEKKKALSNIKDNVARIIDRNEDIGRKMKKKAAEEKKKKEEAEKKKKKKTAKKKSKSLSDDDDE